MRSIQGYVSARDLRQGATVAVCEADKRTTYAELDEASDRLAGTLIAQGVDDGDRVCLIMRRSTEAIIAMLGVLKAGGIYVPIDPDARYPRVGPAIGRLAPAAVLSTEPELPLIGELRAAGALRSDTLVVEHRGRPSMELTLAPSAGTGTSPQYADASLARGSQPAYIMLTSGSTGVPKAVVVTHDNVCSLVDWAIKHFGIDPSDRHSWQPPLQFDLSTFDVWATLTAGAQLHILPPGVLLPRQIFSFIGETALTQWFSVPSAMAYASRAGAGAGTPLPSLKRVIWCGEVIAIPTLRDWMARAPQATFTNLYGPTETTVASAFHAVEDAPAPDAAPIPIGRACDGEEVLVLDSDRRALGPDELGDIYIGGSGVGAGYWQDPIATAAAFVADPRPGHDGEILYRTGDLGWAGADGLVHFAGRIDSQIKSRGYRIELQEVEAAVTAVEAVDEAAVIGVDRGGFEGTAICCAFASPTLGAPELRARVLNVLPPYMVPTVWQSLTTLPKNANGKIDRVNLKHLFMQRTA